MEKIWVDKYRPQTFDEIIGQEYFVSRIRQFVKTKNLPHLLFAGSPGTGKTTTAHVVAKELYGPNGLRGNFLELNASDDRGIDVIRNQIKEFAKLKSLTDIPFKIIVLDEADSLTKEAQQALRRTMERFSNTCRFILACNEISKLIDPIQSRCVIFKFKGLKEEDLLKLIKRLEDNEDISVDGEAKQMLVSIAKGDTRKVLNTLQAASSLSKTIDKKILDEILDYIDPVEVKEMLTFAIEGDFFKARDKLIALKTLNGLSGLEVLKEIYKQLIDMDIDPKVKVKFVDRIATVEFRLVEGSDEDLQLEALLAMMHLLK